jgi:hypothetical protein
MNNLIPYNVYVSEIINFLKTVTIKFTPFINHIDQYNYKKYNISIPKEDKDKKYYRNLVGEYYHTDTIMKVWSIDTNQEIVFDRQMFLDHPKTGALYNILSTEYLYLIQKYPTQIDLIKNIIYPACKGNIDQVIEANNLSLLSYDISLLDVNEQESLLVYLIEYLEYINHRWFFTNYHYEDLYYPAFWGILWPNIALMLLVKRIMNIKTNNAHTFHVWEHLTSNGLANYRTILTNKQALYLYRNIEYILRNRGKMTNLYLLTENLLKDHYISLISKQMFQSIGNQQTQCITTPEILNEKIVNYRQTNTDTETFTSIQDFEYRLYNIGLEPNISNEYINDLETRLGINPYNILQTKFLELQKDPIFSMYIGFMAEFLLDSIMYKYNTGKLKYICIVKDPLTNISIELTIPEAIALVHYTINKSYGDTPVYIPKYYTTRVPYEDTKPNKYIFPQTVQIDNTFFKINQELDIDQILNDIPWNTDVFNTSDKLAELLAKQFSIMMNHIYTIQTNASLIYNLAMTELYEYCIHQELLHLNLSNYNDYESWFKSSDDLITIKAAYQDIAQDSMKDWDKFTNNILDVLIPTNLATFMSYAGYVIESDRLYEGLKDLLKQLSSINIEYLDTSRAIRYYLTLRYISLALTKYSSYDKLHLHFYKSILYDYISKIHAELNIIRDYIYEYWDTYHNTFMYLTFSPQMLISNNELYVYKLLTYHAELNHYPVQFNQSTIYNFGISIDMSNYN